MKIFKNSLIFLTLALIAVAAGATYAFSEAEVVRIYGLDRFETAIKIYRHFFSDRNPRIFILAAGYGPNSESWSPDAICAAPLASALDVPLFLTRRNAIDSVTLSAITKGGFESGIVIGGPGSVSESVVSVISKKGIKLKRLGGVDRYHTSAIVAQEMKIMLSRNPDICFIATGENFPDAIALSFLAGRLKAPILLTRQKAVPFSVKAALNSLNIQRCIIAGGEAAVSRAVESSLPSPLRIAGKDRYETSMKLVRYAVESHSVSTETVFVATGEAFADALLSSPAASFYNSCVLLAPSSFDKQRLTVEFLNGYLKPEKVYLIGGINLQVLDS